MKDNKVFLPVMLLFIFLNSFFLIFKNFLENFGFDREMLMVSNLILFTVSAIAFFLQKRGLKATNPHAFVRSVYLSMIIKLAICMIGVFVYISYVGNNINKPSLFVSMGLYFVYTTIEVIALMKSARNKTNG